MRAWVYGIGSLILLGGPALAQEPAKPAPEPRAVPEPKPSPTSDAKALELKASIEKARLRQRAMDRRNSELWQRWTYAVCIGCGGSFPTPMRIVHTTPGRVLAGIPAADDDARERGWYRART